MRRILSPLFLAGVSEIVLDVPGLAAVCRAAAELPYSVWAHGDELQMPLEGRAARLRNLVGPVVQHAIFQPAVEEDVAAGVVHPVLLPALESLVVDVVAFAGVRTVLTLPVFLNHTVFENQFNPAVSCRNGALRGGHTPFAEPKIKLTILGSISAGALILFGLLEKLGEARVRAQRGEMGIAAHHLRLSVALLHGLFQVLECLV